MILDDVSNRFAIVARQNFSATHAPENRLNLSDADMVYADVTSTRNGVLVCTNDPYMETLTFDDAKKANVLPLLDLMNWAKQAGRGLLLNPRHNSPDLVSRIAGDARFFGVLDRVAVVSHSLRHTKNIRAVSDEVGIVGMLRNPEHYAEFYKRGGNVATLGKLQTAPGNVRLAEAAEGPKRHPFWVLANDADIQDVFNACNGLVGARGMIMRDPAIGREALRRRASSGPACAACAPD